MLAALICVVFGVWLQLRFTRFGAFIGAANHASTDEVVRRFHKPGAAIGRGAPVSRCLLSPVETLLPAAFARLRAPELTADFGVTAIAASCLYVLAAYGGMKVIDLTQRQLSPAD